MKFINELKRRNVIRVAGAYLVVGWFLIQLADQLVVAFHLPSWSNSFVFVMLGIGLPITMLVAWAFEMTPEGLRRTHESEPHRSVATSPVRVGDYLVLVALLVICGYLYYDFQSRDGDQGDGTLTVGAMAVLPFANLSVEPEQEGVSRALTAEVRNRLTRLGGLKVVAGTASLKPDDNQDLAAIGEKYRVPVVLDGSVQRVGNRLRVMAQLVDTERGVQLWAKTFNRDVSDMLSVQDDLSQAIVEDIRKAITPPAPEEGMGDLATGKNAYGAAARKLLETGRAKLTQRTPESLATAITALEQALARDPRLAQAHAAMAEAYLLQGKGWSTYGTVPLEDALARARPYAARALEIDPALAEGHAVSGLIDLASGHADQAITKLKKAVERKPALARARLWLYQAYAARNRLADAVPQLQRAYELEPDNLAIGLNMSRFLALRDRRLEADTLLDRLDRLYPGNINLLAARGARLADEWRPVDAIQLLLRANKSGPADERIRLMLGMAYLDLGATAEAERWFDQGKGDVRLAQGRAADALVEARHLFAAEPANPDRAFALADAELAAGNPSGAIDVLKPYELLSSDGAGPLYGRTPASMPALTLAAAKRAVGDEAGAAPLLEGARRYLARQREMGFEHPYFIYLDARIAALSGDAAQAMAALRQAVSQRFPGISGVAWDPALASLRDLPEYRMLVADLDADRERRRIRLREMGLLGAS